MPEPDRRSEPPVGRVWPDARWEVGEEALRRYATAVGEAAPIFHSTEAAREAGFAAIVGAPGFAAVYCAPAVAAAIFDPEVGLFDPEVGISSYRFVHKRQQFRWHRPVVAGDVLTTSARLAAATETGDGRARRVFESETVDAAGEPVLSARYEGVTTGSGGRRKRGGPADSAFAARAEPVEQPARSGDRFPPLRLVPGPEATRLYAEASGDFTPFHLDDAAAHAVGLPDVILHGLYSFAQVIRAHTAPWGGDPRVLTELAGQFRRPAFPDRELMSEIEVVESSGGELRTRGALLQDDAAVIEAVEGALRPTAA